ncbi:MAG: hypothetical protein J6B85_11630 [Lachnospiraceae bacterium]|nr:hypothetical protein [Lachnospiraceae bacterium]
MKLKYTKWMIALTMTAMGVGMTAFSFEQPKVELPAATTLESENLEAKLADEEFGEIQKSGFAAVPQTEANSTGPAVMNVEPETEPAPIDVPLEENLDAQIDELIEQYLSAKLVCDIEEFEGLVTDTDLIELDKLQRKTEYVETYENVENYIKPAEGDIDYIVYVYQELKITSIDTLAPALDEILIRYDESGTPRIVLGEISDETANYIAEARQTDEVEELITQVGEKLTEALESDEALAEFYSKLGSAPTAK